MCFIKFSKSITIKFNGHTAQAIGYRIAARNKLDCMLYNNLQKFYLSESYLSALSELKQYQKFKKCNDQWLKDNKHAFIVLRIYDPKTNTYYESTHFITQRPDSVFDATTLEYKIPKKVIKDFYVIIEGSITQVNPNDPYAKVLGLNLESDNIVFDEEKGCHVSSNGKVWTNFTKENIDLAVSTILKTCSENANLIDHTDNLYTHDAVLKEHILKEDFSVKTPEQIDEKLHALDAKLKIPDKIIDKIKEMKSYIIKTESKKDTVIQEKPEDE